MFQVTVLYCNVARHVSSYSAVLQCSNTFQATVLYCNVKHMFQVTVLYCNVATHVSSYSAVLQCSKTCFKLQCCTAMKQHMFQIKVLHWDAKARFPSKVWLNCIELICNCKITCLLDIDPGNLTLKAPRKNVSENIVCWSRLLQIIA